MVIPGIVKIGWVYVDNIPDMTYPLTISFWVNDGINPLPPIVTGSGIILKPEFIELTKVASLKEEAESDSLGFACESTLDFYSEVEIPLIRKIAFVAYDVLGNKYLVGSGLPHSGSLKRIGQIDSPEGGASVFHYSFKVPVPVIKVF